MGTKRTLDYIKANLGKGAQDMEAIIEELNNKDMRGATERQLREYNQDLLGAEIANRYAQRVVQYEENIAKAQEAIKDYRAAYKAGEISMSEYREAKSALEDAIREYRISQVEGLWETANNLRELIGEGKAKGKSFFQKVLDRANEVRHWAYSDLKGVPTTTQQRPTNKAKYLNTGIHQFTTMSLYTFNTMLREFGRRAFNGQGYLFDGFGRRWMDLASNEWLDNRKDMDELNAKANELFGNLRAFGKGPKLPFKYKWHNLIDVLHSLPKIDVVYKDGGDMLSHPLDQAQAAYIYAASKQTDGVVKLRAMGISEADVERIVSELDPRVIELMDWLQEEFLPSRREGYNEVYERMFGVPMTANDNYFPLEIDKLSISKKEGLGVEGKNQNASTVVGSVKERRFNVQPLDLLNANVISMVSKHLDEMNHWKHFAEFNRDLNTLINDKTFKAKVYNMETLYGSGEKLWDRFVNTSLIASGDYIPEGGSEADRIILNIAKLVSVAKVNFRTFTATKQALSFLTFTDKCSPKYFAKNLWNEAGTIKWCFDNMPLFEKRWMSRRAGDARLVDTDLDWKWTRKKMIKWAGKWGMTPNAAVDLWACAIGSRSVYETMRDRYLNDGYSQEEAHKRAIQDAQIAFNESQQSSEKMFVAPLQVDRTVQSVAFSVFRTSPFGFTRLATRGLKDIKYACSPHKWAENTVYMYKKMRRDGLTEAQAKEVAKAIHTRALTRGLLSTFMYAFGAQFFWNYGSKLPYILGSDNSEKKNDILKEESLHAALAGYIEGLPGGSLVSDQLSEIINAIIDTDNLEDAWSEWKKNTMFKDNELLPLLSDMESLKNTMLGKEYLTGVTDLFNLIIQSSVGVNPQTVTDAGVAILDACHGDVETAKEAMLLWYRIFQVPQSQIEDIYIEESKKAIESDKYIEEIGMSKKDAEKLSIDDFARRYAGYRRLRRAPYMWEWYNDGRKKELVKKYEDRFFEKLNASVEDPMSYKELADRSPSRRDNYISKWVDALAAQGPEALEGAYNDEKDPKLKKKLLNKYNKLIDNKSKEEETKDNVNSAMEAATKEGQEKSDRGQEMAKHLGFNGMNDYNGFSKAYKSVSSKSDTLVFKLTKDYGARPEYRKDKKLLPMSEVSWKPVTDPKKEAAALKLLNDNPEHFRFVLRTRWRNEKINELVEEAKEDESKVEANYKEIRRLMQDQRADFEGNPQYEKK